MQYPVRCSTMPSIEFHAPWAQFSSAAQVVANLVAIGVTAAAITWSLVAVVRIRRVRAVEVGDGMLVALTFLVVSFGGWLVPFGPAAALGYQIGRHMKPSRAASIQPPEA